MQTSRSAGSLRRICGVTALMFAAACVGTQTRHHASVLAYLYPGRQDYRVDSTTTVLRLPLRVGVAFVPSESEFRAGPLSESDRLTLLDSVAARFRNQPFVQNIEIVPSAYLQAGGGFQNLDQLQRMFDIDVIALVSYDQMQFTDTKRSALTYWTIAGAYLIEGEKNDTRTMLDAAVFDIASRKLLFRAPGVSQIKGSAALATLSDEQRQDSRRGFELAQRDLTPNLERELERFRARVRADPSIARIDTTSRRQDVPSVSGAGSSIDVLTIVLALVAAAATLVARRRPS